MREFSYLPSYRYSPSLNSFGGSKLWHDKLEGNFEIRMKHSMAKVLESCVDVLSLYMWKVVFHLWSSHNPAETRNECTSQNWPGHANFCQLPISRTCNIDFSWSIGHRIKAGIDCFRHIGGSIDRHITSKFTVSALQVVLCPLSTCVILIWNITMFIWQLT